ncbi:MAG: methyltransferase domain-containing protein [Gemmatimonadetes bacterium]|nr:class I SAM-dependent methyltransferase [Gemmatimonadota bacterium]NIQ57312.1 class I SAM-dependent methyltransferase [Gemmatimonadota bacterium]NIU77470.1 methyltransferase domain-containing protein [Gammaproteobacteria bacterium]NIX46693.1 methyltransferase domain-containing protein [Gemmatimonadota bacterium]NIY11036.1 methyltransferase domain-containing protein [Gemmatimonadota bacterium]
MATSLLARVRDSAPRRYDLGIRLLTAGRLDGAYDRLVGGIRRDDRVLDLGCGTGALTLRAARRGGVVRALAGNHAMLEIAAARVRDAGLATRVELAALETAQLAEEPTGAYDVVTVGLCLYNLGNDVLSEALPELRRMLRPGGLLLAADRIRPRNRLGRSLHSLARAPLLVLARSLTWRLPAPVDALPERLTAAGFQLEEVRRSRLGGFATYVARRPLEVA